MQEEIFSALESGATLITVNRRLARSFARVFHLRQTEQGRAVWRPPDILPLDAFLDRAWNDRLWRDAGDALVLLSPLQEEMIWEQVIRASAAGETLLRIPETARLAGDTWRLIQAYRLPVDGRFQATEDWAAFADWSREFEKRCRINHWLEPARLGDFIARRDVAQSGPVYIAGFDDLTPQQEALFAALGNPAAIEPPRHQPTVVHSRFEDAIAEISAAAQWSRRLLEQQPETTIGIIVPDLAQSRAKIERIFRQVLDPGAALADQERCFHVSLGAPLAGAPLVHAALLILEFAAGLPLPSLGVLLRSPFLAGFESEWTRRGLMDAELRRKGLWNVTAAMLRRETSQLPILQRSLARFQKLAESLAPEQRPSEWNRDFSALLDALGWPGDRPLNSREYQVLQAWRELLSNFAALDLTSPRLSFDQALSRLRDIAARNPFQIENEHAPIQILGSLEAAGLSFDHLWIMGLHDEAMPSPAAPNPFLPLSLQREHNLPHCSAGRELEFSRNLIARLQAGAPDVVVSCPASDGDRSLSPTPLLSGPWSSPPREISPAGEWILRMHAGASFRQVSDQLAPPVTAGAEQRGGSSLFKNMAACPFSAFAKHRLSAKPLDEAVPGLSYRDRGNTVHRALQIIWRELASQERLNSISAHELEALISGAAAEAVNSIPHAIGRGLEQRRLETLLQQWLQLEKSRPPFTVHAVETTRDVSVGGLSIHTRADRIDELASAGDLILDYKTGRLKSDLWSSDRPSEPQLPLYCATSERRVAAAAFAQVRTGEIRFQGLAEDLAAPPSMKRVRMDEPLPFQEQIRRWREVLEQLAQNFQSGHAEVNPKGAACDHCGLWALCRIRELPDER